MSFLLVLAVAASTVWLLMTLAPGRVRSAGDPRASVDGFARALDALAPSAPRPRVRRRRRR